MKRTKLKHHKYCTIESVDKKVYRIDICKKHSPRINGNLEVSKSMDRRYETYTYELTY